MIERRQLQIGSKPAPELNLIVGAKRQTQHGWISTDIATLDIRRDVDWARSFAPNSIDRILCESCLEHMTFEDGFAACRNFYKYLKPGGRVRIAVPDANFRNESYQWWTRPGGGGQTFSRWFVYAPHEPDHKVFYDFQSLTTLVRRAGFDTKLVEYFDAGGNFHKNHWSYADGEVTRSLGHPRVARLKLWLGFDFISLIVDGFKR
ncbi:MAG: class I SAM-dependent methyltransferase [Pyrinomonadaceae bacterium]